MRSLYIAVFSFLLPTLVFAVEYKRIQINNIDEASVIKAPKGCNATIKRKFWFDKKKSIDCYAILLKNTSGIDQTGNQKSIGDVIIHPASSDLNEALENIPFLISAINKEVKEGVKIKLSNLTYLEDEIPLSAITQNDSDADKTVVAGGISFSVITKRGGYTYTNKTGMGLKARD